MTRTCAGVMIGRGHVAGPCPALSYVERAISVLTFFFFFSKKKKLKTYKEQYVYK